LSSFSRTTDTGNYEAPSHTLGALIEREWLKANTDQDIPKFLYDQDSANVSNPTDMMEAIAFTDGGTLPIPERTALGHGLVGVGEVVVMTVYAATQKRRKLFEFEIQRILRKNRPIAAASFTPIKKSDQSSNSAIHDYDEILPEFVAFNDDVEGQEKSSKSSAIITLLMEWVFS
jgi:hypothetical protein